jgi:hypothetical protein
MKFFSYPIQSRRTSLIFDILETRRNRFICDESKQVRKTTHNRHCKVCRPEINNCMLSVEVSKPINVMDKDLYVTIDEKSSNGHTLTKIMSTNNCYSNIPMKRRKLILHFDNRNTLQVSFNVSLCFIVRN